MLQRFICVTGGASGNVFAFVPTLFSMSRGACGPAAAQVRSSALNPLEPTRTMHVRMPKRRMTSHPDIPIKRPARRLQDPYRVPPLDARLRQFCGLALVAQPIGEADDLPPGHRCRT